jgi:isoquinoline 1-oxidoreductase
MRKTDDLLSQSRRTFLKRLGGGIVVFVGFRGRLPSANADAPGGRAGDQEVPTDFNAFVRIAEDGRISCFTGKIEMGQGPITSLVQMLADELDVAYERVDILMGDTDLCPWDRGTWGSLTTRQFGPLLRAAAAEARAVLLQLGSESLDAPVSRLAVREGVIFERGNEANRVTYGALATGKEIARHLKVKPELKDYADFRIMGQPKLRRDSLEKVTGEAKYAADIRVPGMLYAKLLRPPAHGAKLRKVSTAGARSVPGATVIEDGDLVAVLHELPDVAKEALDRIKADFDRPSAELTDANIHAHLRDVAPRDGVTNRSGSLGKGRKLAKRIVLRRDHTRICTVWLGLNIHGHRDLL